MVTDTMGNLLAINVHAANVHDTKSGITVAKKAVAKYPTIKGFCADAGYRKTFVLLVFAILGLFVNIVERICPGFELLPRRWIVERTFAWANHSRRLSKDYEIKTSHAENMFMISHLATLIRRY